MERLYLCDPKKNTKCSKTACVHNPNSAYPVCRHTHEKKYRAWWWPFALNPEKMIDRKMKKGKGAF